MANITITQSFTFPEESVKWFAIYLGWREKITQQKVSTNWEVENIEIDNPQTFASFVEEKAKEHTQKFVLQYANRLKQERLAEEAEKAKNAISPILDEEIINPIKEALVSSISWQAE